MIEDKKFTTRKVIALNGTALVVSLPKEYTDKNNISKGDTMKVFEDDKTLIISKID